MVIRKSGENCCESLILRKGKCVVIYNLINARGRIIVTCNFD